MAIGLAIAVLAAAPTTAAAQLLPVRTIPLPLAEGEQFFFFPSENAGMAGVSIALADSAHDPFVNPAKAGRLQRTWFFSTRTAFSVSDDAGKGSTLPVGVVGRVGNAFAGLALATQSVNDGRRDFSTAGESHSNRYGFVLLGRRYPSSKLSVGASALWSDLSAIDGVNRLYTDSRTVGQSGGTSDMRVGVLKEMEGGQTLEGLILHNRVAMAHEVTYDDPYWDAVRRQVITRRRVAHERERTRTWGLHLQYERPLGDSGWRAGARFTANSVQHPERPAYDVADLPGDHGRSTALNLGVGLARSKGGTTFGVDAIYEPVWSRLLARADSAIPSSASGPIAAGETMMRSRLHFSNVLLRAGLSRDVVLDEDGTSFAFQVGMQARSVRGRVDQRNMVQGASRTGGLDWMEWTRSWGYSLRLPPVEVRYVGRQTSGTSRPRVVSGDVVLVDVAPLPHFGIGPGPVPSLTDVRVTTHQITISVPIR